MQRVTAVVIALLLYGCAKFPGQEPPPPSRDRLIITLTYAVTIDRDFFYFVAMDDDEDQLTGPLPALTPPWGNGWGVVRSEISRISHFVKLYRQPTEVFKILEFQPPFTSQPLGAPLELTLLQPNQMRLTLDLRQLFPNFPAQPTRLELNFIGVDEIILDPNFNGRRNYDALGPTGNDFISVPLTSTQTFRNGQVGLIQETSGDATIDALDLTDWEVQVLRVGD